MPKRPADRFPAIRRSAGDGFGAGRRPGEVSLQDDVPGRKARRPSRQPAFPDGPILRSCAEGPARAGDPRGRASALQSATGFRLLRSSGPNGAGAADVAEAVPHAAGGAIRRNGVRTRTRGAGRGACRPMSGHRPRAGRFGGRMRGEDTPRSLCWIREVRCTSEAIRKETPPLFRAGAVDGSGGVRSAPRGARCGGSSGSAAPDASTLNTAESSDSTRFWGCLAAGPKF